MHAILVEETCQRHVARSAANHASTSCPLQTWDRSTPHARQGKEAAFELFVSNKNLTFKLPNSSKGEHGFGTIPA